MSFVLTSSAPTGFLLIYDYTLVLVWSSIAASAELRNVSYSEVKKYSEDIKASKNIKIVTVDQVKENV